MIKKLYIFTLALAVSAVGSQAFANAVPHSVTSRSIEELLIEPGLSYNKEVIESPGWKGNWFIGVDAGASSFLGTPQGCNDLWGRIKPHFGAYFGKWYTPTVAAASTSWDSISSIPITKLRITGVFQLTSCGISPMPCMATAR